MCRSLQIAQISCPAAPAKSIPADRSDQLASQIATDRSIKSCSCLAAKVAPERSDELPNACMQPLQNGPERTDQLPSRSRSSTIYMCGSRSRSLDPIRCLYSRSRLLQIAQISCPAAPYAGHPRALGSAAGPHAHFQPRDTPDQDAACGRPGVRALSDARNIGAR